MSVHPNPDHGLVDMAIAYLQAERRRCDCEIEALVKATRVFQRAIGEPAPEKTTATPRRKPPAPSARARRSGGGAARAAEKSPPVKAVAAAAPSITQPPMERNGVTIRFDHDAESIAFNGGTADLTARHASFLEVLLSSSPDPVTREFIATRLWTSPPAMVDIAISKLCAETRALLAPIGLDVRTFRRAGVALLVAEGK